MTASRDPDRLIRAFLQEGIAELPDRTFDTVRAVIDRTQQRVGFDPRRTFRMPTLLRIAGALTVAVVLVAGASFLLRPTGLVGGSPSPATSGPGPSGTVSPTVSTSQPAASGGLTYGWPAPLEPGTYTTSFVWALPSDLSFAVPSGWDARDIEIVKDNASISVQFAAGTFADPCSADSLRKRAFDEGWDLAEDLAATPTLEVTDVTSATFAGAPARYLEYTAKADVPCVGDTSQLWTLPTNDALPVGPFNPAPWPLRPGTHRVWILDDSNLVIDATAGADPTAAATAEFQAVLDSFRFVPLSQARSVGSCDLQLSSPNTPGPSLTPPYTLTMSMTRYDVHGVTPVDQFPPPRAQIDFYVDPASIVGTGDPGLSVVPPPGSDKQGYGTHMPDSESGPVLGTFLLDDPGQWWIQIHVPAGRCYYQLPITVLPIR